MKLLHEIQAGGYALDYNGAGTSKPLCREPYPPHWVIEEAIKLSIPLVYGSDAHQAKELGQGIRKSTYPLLTERLFAGVNTLSNHLNISITYLSAKYFS